MVVLPSSSGRPGPTPGAAGGQLTDCPATAFSSSAGGEETRPNPILAAGTKSRTHRLESILTNSCGAKAWATARCSVVVKRSTSPPDSLSVRAVTSSSARQPQCLRSRPSADERLIPARPSAPTKPNLLKRPAHARANDAHVTDGLVVMRNGPNRSKEEAKPWTSSSNSC